jgi:hypothetical protein
MLKLTDLSVRLRLRFDPTEPMGIQAIFVPGRKA